jgi:hypothetical protein
MKCSHRISAGFGLTELVVASAAAAMMFALLAPALNKGQAGVDVRRCQDNLRRLARAHFMYVGNFGGFPPMARAWPGVSNPLPGPGAWYDDHGWYSLIGPYIGEPAWAATINFSRSLSDSTNLSARRGGLRLKIHACPADIGLQRQEFISVWARVHSNFVVNAGNTDYGQATIGNVPFLGAPFAGGLITPLPTITDGLSRTLLMSEVVVFPETLEGWGSAYSDTQTALSGQVFNAFNPPNSNTPDVIGRGIFGGLGQAQAIQLYLQQGIPVPVAPPTNDTMRTYIAPRSKHPGGFNTVMCNGATGFIANDIDLAVWRALSTAQGAEGL